MDDNFGTDIPEAPGGPIDSQTTVAVQRYLNELAVVGADTPAEPIVRDLLGRAVDRLYGLCAAMLFRSYPRLTRPPLNLRAEEMLGAVVERLLKAMREVRPGTVRQFFALANQHMRWELNDLARRLDEQAAAVELTDSAVAASPETTGASLSPNTLRILQVIDNLPEEEREAFNLVRVQGLSQPEAAAVLGVSAKTVQRRLNRCRLLLADQLGDLEPSRARPSGGSGEESAGGESAP